MQKVFNKLRIELRKMSNKARPVGWSTAQEIVLLKNALSLVDQVEEEYEASTAKKHKWIPTGERLPSKERMRVWMSFTEPWGAYVKRGVWACGHFEWDNGRRLKELPDAWMPLYKPEPY